MSTQSNWNLSFFIKFQISYFVDSGLNFTKNYDLSFITMSYQIIWFFKAKLKVFCACYVLKKIEQREEHRLIWLSHSINRKKYDFWIQLFRQFFWLALTRTSCHEVHTMNHVHRVSMAFLRRNFHWLRRIVLIKLFWWHCLFFMHKTWYNIIFGTK